ncbi:MAG: hypothetical protein MHM6MM_000840 [Cercozoa sp. M6MM]
MLSIRGEGDLDLRNLKLTGEGLSNLSFVATRDLTVRFDAVNIALPPIVYDTLFFGTTSDQAPVDVSIEGFPGVRFVDTLKVSGELRRFSCGSLCNNIEIIRLLQLGEQRLSGSSETPWLQLPSLSIIDHLTVRHHREACPFAQGTVVASSFLWDAPVGGHLTDIAHVAVCVRRLRADALRSMVVRTRAADSDIAGELASVILENVVSAEDMQIELSSDSLGQQRVRIPQLRWVTQSFALSIGASAGSWSVELPRLEAVNSGNWHLQRLNNLDLCALQSVSTSFNITGSGSDTVHVFWSQSTVAGLAVSIDSVLTDGATQCRRDAVVFAEAATDSRASGLLLRDYMQVERVNETQKAIKLDSSQTVQSSPTSYVSCPRDTLLVIVLLVSVPFEKLAAPLMDRTSMYDVNTSVTVLERSLRSLLPVQVLAWLHGESTLALPLHATGHAVGRCLYTDKFLDMSRVLPHLQTNRALLHDHAVAGSVVVHNDGNPVSVTGLTTRPADSFVFTHSSNSAVDFWDAATPLLHLGTVRAWPFRAALSAIASHDASSLSVREVRERAVRELQLVPRQNDTTPADALTRLAHDFVDRISDVYLPMNEARTLSTLGESSALQLLVSLTLPETVSVTTSRPVSATPVLFMSQSASHVIEEGVLSRVDWRAIEFVVRHHWDNKSHDLHRSTALPYGTAYLPTLSWQTDLGFPAPALGALTLDCIGRNEQGEFYACATHVLSEVVLDGTKQSWINFADLLGATPPYPPPQSDELPQPSDEEQLPPAQLPP